MKRVFLGLIVLVAVTAAGGYVFLSSNLDMITSAIGKAVESATGKPLVLDAPPSLAIFPELGLDVGKARWGDERDEVSMTFDRAVVRVDFMALLGRRIEVREITLDTPRVAFRQTAGIAEPAPPPATNAGNSAGGTPSQAADWESLRLDAVRVTSGEVRIERPGADLRLSGLNLELANFAAGQEGALELAARLALGGADGSLTEADVTLKTGFVPRYPLVTLRDCAVTLTPGKGLPIAKPVSLGGGAAIDAALMALSQADLSVEFAGSRLRVTGQAGLDGPTGPDGPSDLTGRFAVALRGSPRETLAACGLTLTPRDPQALGALELEGQVKLDKGKLELDDLRGKLDDTAVSGRLSLAAASVSGSLKLGSLDVDRYLPAPSGSGGSGGGQAPTARTAPAAEKPGPGAKRQAAGAASGTASYPDVRLELAVDSLRVNKLSLAGIKALVQGKAGRYALDPCTFGFYGSAVSLAVRAQIAEQQYSLKTTANNLNAGDLLKDAAGLDTVAGTVNLRADLSLRGADEAAIRRSLGGTAGLTGRIKVDTALLPSGWGSMIQNADVIAVNNIDVAAKADKGRIVLQPVAADGQVGIKGQGTVDLPSDGLDLRLDATLAGLTMPLLIRGTLARPSYGVDPAGALKNVLENPKAAKAVERGLKGLLKKF